MEQFKIGYALIYREIFNSNPNVNSFIVCSICSASLKYFIIKYYPYVNCAVRWKKIIVFSLPAPNYEEMQLILKHPVMGDPFGWIQLLKNEIEETKISNYLNILERTINKIKLVLLHCGFLKKFFGDKVRWKDNKEFMSGKEKVRHVVTEKISLTLLLMLQPLSKAVSKFKSILVTLLVTDWPFQKSPTLAWDHFSDPPQEFLRLTFCCQSHIQTPNSLGVEVGHFIIVLWNI